MNVDNKKRYGKKLFSLLISKLKGEIGLKDNLNISVFNSTLLLQRLFALLIAFQAFLDFTLLVITS